jgi:predicted tellurium resistance membrane protein TerC
MGRFRYLDLGLATVLVFVGAKMLVSDVYKVPVALSLVVIVVVLAIAIGASLWTGGRTGHRRRARGSGQSADALTQGEGGS